MSPFFILHIPDECWCLRRFHFRVFQSLKSFPVVLDWYCFRYEATSYYYLTYALRMTAFTEISLQGFPVFQDISCGDKLALFRV